MGILFSKTQPGQQERIIDSQKNVRFTSNLSNEGLLGSSTGSKTTLDIAYLFNAMDEGLQLFDCTEAITITRMPTGSSHRYRIDSYNHRENSHHLLLTDYVFLCAGTLNTLRLLFRSQAQAQSLGGMEALGNNVATNADTIAFWLRNLTEADFTTGMPCHGPVSFRDGKDQAQFIQAGVSGLNEIPMPSLLKKQLQRSLFFIGMGIDENNGKASWQKGRLSISYSTKESHIYQHIYRRLDEIRDHYQRPLFFSKNFAATVHPLGGAPINNNSNEGLINGCGEIHDHPGLFIGDATALPASPGMPPSMSIAAWSRHVATRFLQQQGAQTTQDIGIKNKKVKQLSTHS